MFTPTSLIHNLWNSCIIAFGGPDYGLSRGDHAEPYVFPLFLKLADEPRPTSLTPPARKTSFNIIVITISKIGNSHGLMFDAALMDLAHLKAGDQVNVEVHEGGTITLTPLPPKPSRAEASRVIDATMKDYARTMTKLA
jgi:antitoxin component of MazEF toxin-antitoxin module